MLQAVFPNVPITFCIWIVIEECLDKKIISKVFCPFAKLTSILSDLGAIMYSDFEGAIVKFFQVWIVKVQLWNSFTSFVAHWLN